MKIKALQTFHTPNHPEFQAGQEYEVAESVGEIFIERGLAEDARPPKKPGAAFPSQEVEETKPTKRSRSN